METAAELVQRVLITLDWSQVRLAREIGKDRKTVGRWASGRNEPKHSDVERLKELLASQPEPAARKKARKKKRGA